MPLPPFHDLSSLARLAQNPAAELRPLLLRVQAQDYARAPVRDETLRANFEALALGLIPLVADDVLAEVRALLRDVADVPASVCAALAGRSAEAGQAVSGERTAPNGGTEAEGPSAAGSSRARDRAAAVDRAVRDPALATRLLKLPDLSAFDRAALYRWASREQRAAIRRDLGPALAASGRRSGPAPGTLVPTILRAAEGGDLGAILAAVVTRLRVEPEPFDFGTEAGRELFAMALLALGLDDVECVRAIILLGTGPFRTVPVVSDLAAVARTTPWDVACFLAGSEGPARRRAIAAAPFAEPASARSHSRERRGDPARISPVRDGRAAGSSVRTDRQP